jgi:hypothetical protein
MSLSGKTVKLQPSDNVESFLKVPIEVARMSATIKNMLDGILSSFHLPTKKR